MVRPKKLGDRLFGDYAVKRPFKVLLDTWEYGERLLFYFAVTVIPIGLLLSMLIRLLTPELAYEIEVYLSRISLWVDTGGNRILFYSIIGVLFSYVTVVFGAWIIRHLLNLVSILYRKMATRPY